MVYARSDFTFNDLQILTTFTKKILPQRLALIRDFNLFWPYDPFWPETPNAEELLATLQRMPHLRDIRISLMPQSERHRPRWMDPSLSGTTVIMATMSRSLRETFCLVVLDIAL